MKLNQFLTMVVFTLCIAYSVIVVSHRRSREKSDAGISLSSHVNPSYVQTSYRKP